MRHEKLNTTQLSDKIGKIDIDLTNKVYLSNFSCVSPFSHLLCALNECGALSLRLSKRLFLLWTWTLPLHYLFWISTNWRPNRTNFAKNMCACVRQCCMYVTELLKKNYQKQIADKSTSIHLLSQKVNGRNVAQQIDLLFRKHIVRVMQKYRIYFRNS